jgi:hypothetical protein
MCTVTMRIKLDSIEICRRYRDTLPTHSQMLLVLLPVFNIPSNWVGIVLVIGIEISMGFDRSTSMFSIVAIIIFNHKGQ